jgi:hypothetical protein
MDNQPRDADESSASDGVPAVSGGRVLGRRAVLRAGASATPVLMTLASSPVAAANSCVVASSFVSVATFKSRNPTATLQCSSKTCENWRSDASTLSTYRAFLDSTTVASLLGTTSPASSYASSKLSAVLTSGSGIVKDGEIGVLQHLISLCMNIKIGNAPMPGNVTQGYLGGVWKNYKANSGRYIVSGSGINWNAAELITWIRLLVYVNP